MKVTKAARKWIDYHKTHFKKKYRTVLLVGYRPILPGVR